MGIGTGLGMNLGLVGGMVVSGAMFGDKMSPFSDTTNLAPAVSGTTIYKHINSMIYTVTPAFIITFVLYAVLSMKTSTAGAEMETVDAMLTALSTHFNITPILLIVPIVGFNASAFKSTSISGNAVKCIFSNVHGNGYPGRSL